LPRCGESVFLKTALYRNNLNGRIMASPARRFLERTLRERRVLIPPPEGRIHPAAPVRLAGLPDEAGVPFCMMVFIDLIESPFQSLQFRPPFPLQPANGLRHS